MLNTSPQDDAVSCPSYPRKMKAVKVVSLLVASWFVLVILYILIEQYPSQACSRDIPSEGMSRSISEDPFESLDLTSKPEIVAKCIDQRLLHIGGLERQINRWRVSQHKICNQLFNLFNVLLRVESRTGHLNVTDGFKKKLLKWFGGNKDLVTEVQTQSVIFVNNKWTFDATVFNPIRDKRPIVKPELTDTQYVEQLAASTAKSCDFCNYKQATSPDFYGTIENKYSYTASNAFKLDAFHALVIFRNHHPNRWNEAILMDAFTTALQWFKRVNKHNPDYIYPYLLWDMLPHASASQVHPHMHVILANKPFWGNQKWRQVFSHYGAQFGGRDYFHDLLAIHDILGLNVKHGSANAFASLTPKKDHEFVITSSAANRDFFQMVYYILRGFIDDLEKLCFSMTIDFPPLQSNRDTSSMPVLLRVVTRGTASEIRSDISSMELFSASNVNVDPFKAVKMAQQSMAKRSSRS